MICFCRSTGSGNSIRCVRFDSVVAAAVAAAVPATAVAVGVIFGRLVYLRGAVMSSFDCLNGFLSPRLMMRWIAASQTVKLEAGVISRGC